VQARRDRGAGPPFDADSTMTLSDMVLDPPTARTAAPPAGEGSGRPLVTIGLNCYKAERWIAECLDSLLAQTVQDFEIVISDNASPDRTFEVVSGYAARDPRIRVSRTDRNIGVAGNLNRVFETARGEYFFWAAATDWYDPRFLERCIGRMQRDPSVDLVASQLASFVHDRRSATTDPRQVRGESDSPVERVVSLLRDNRDGRLFRGVYRADAIRPFFPLGSRFGQDVILVAGVSSRGKVVMLDEEPYYFERNAPGATTFKIPAHLRVGYYEPEAGLRAYVFHRTRNQVALWGIALRAARGPAETLRAVRGMLGVSLSWLNDVYDDVYDIGGLARGYLRSWLGTHRA
jgi:glycosyltransferase involved in cell wall biosynthesis